MIEDLLESVERAEQHARLVSASGVDMPRVEVQHIRDTFIYNFSYNQELVGVA
jgi:hypothetical protein